jgi:hypothetical protein
LLEVPVTVTAPYFSNACRRARTILETTRLSGKVAHRLFPRLAWLYPKGNNHRFLPRLLRAVLAEGRDYAEFMIHSSELMPGGSPRFPTARTIETLYETLEALFEMAHQNFVGQTMNEYRARFLAKSDRALARC